MTEPVKLPEPNAKNNNVSAYDAPTVNQGYVPEEVRVTKLHDQMKKEWDQFNVGGENCYTFEGQLCFHILRARESAKQYRSRVAELTRQVESLQQRTCTPETRECSAHPGLSLGKPANCERDIYDRSRCRYCQVPMGRP
jgi:hypothetical protein